jgi:hypothetical protein
VCRIRFVEQAIGALWKHGLWSGELQLGEEAVLAGS